MLNPQQREAMRYIDGSLLVLAGAGSDKTRAIVEKITYLIEMMPLLRVINTLRREIGSATLTDLAEYAQKNIPLFYAIVKLKKFHDFIRVYQAQISSAKFIRHLLLVSLLLIILSGDNYGGELKCFSTNKY